MKMVKAKTPRLSIEMKRQCHETSMLKPDSKQVWLLVKLKGTESSRSTWYLCTPTTVTMVGY